MDAKHAAARGDVHRPDLQGSESTSGWVRLGHAGHDADESYRLLLVAELAAEPYEDLDPDGGFV